MDENTRIVILRSYIKDVFLVIAGALVTYFTKRVLSNRQRRLEMEKKEKAIITEAVSFLSISEDEIDKLIADGNYERFKKIIRPTIFSKLEAISFQLKRIENQEVWNIFERTYNAFVRLANFILNPTMPSAYSRQLEELKKDFTDKRREFVKYCIDYLKLKK